jgi:predicted nuclease of predicted toxin-antitoxin system
VKILLDMNLSPDWVPFLVQAGFEATHWSSVGDPRASDATILEWVREHHFVLFTHDLDFGALLAGTRAQGPSVIQVRTQDTLPAAIGHDVVRVLRLRQDVLERGALVTIDRASSRVRILPILGDNQEPDA